MLKRQDSLLSSSSRRDHTPPQPEKRQAKSVGCLAGIVHFLSKYQIRRRRKFLTFGKKQSQSTVQKPSPKAELHDETPIYPEKKLIDPVGPVINVGGSDADEVPTKTRPLGNRPSNTSLSENKCPRTSVSSSSSEETRRKLLDALDKCDNDLKALKEIIQTVRFQEAKEHKILLQEDDYYSAAAAATKHGTRFEFSEKPYELTHSAFSNSNIYSRRHATISVMAGGRIAHEQKPSPRKKPAGESYDDVLDVGLLNKVAKEMLEARYKLTRRSSYFWSSKAMIESVDEVCGDISWGEKREFTRLGSELEEFICGELIEEFMRDFGFSEFEFYSLPYEKCKRRIQF